MVKRRKKAARKASARKGAKTRKRRTVKRKTAARKGAKTRKRKTAKRKTAARKGARKRKRKTAKRKTAAKKGRRKTAKRKTRRKAAKRKKPAKRRKKAVKRKKRTSLKRRPARKTKTRKKRRGGGGLTKTAYPLSADLACITGKKSMTRPQIMKGVWAYIKRHKLQDAKHRRMIKPDKKLSAIIGTKPIDMLKLAGCLNKHIK